MNKKIQIKENRRVRVSVIMPFYNEEKYLGMAIDSILRQTFEEWELIIINDGSNDKSGEIVKTYTDPRIRYFVFEKNKGKPYANNLGMQEAKGEYIAIFDADDIAAPNMLKCQVEYLDKHSECVRVQGARACIDENNNVIIDKVRNKYRTDIEIRAYELYGNCLTGGSSLYRKETVVKYGLEYNLEARVSQDYLFWIDMLPCGKFGYIDEIVYYYRMSYGSQSQKISNENRVWYDGFMRKIFMHAWVQRGYCLEDDDIRFIYDFLHKGAFVWKYSDVRQGISTFRKIKQQTKRLGLEERNLIVKYYKEMWKQIYLNYLRHNRVAYALESVIYKKR